ncbi:hypothetical protein PP744_gp015 [Rhizobium phage RHph_N38]|uniref:Uncharacterized protein n=1 Tax=Rhizobium phage RHph_N38 TaxID=2509750 RepID=A0A7S5UWS5_9CAUD|nr:hypothetical protein PP744_gp015 [Rhizobium phage RHph_N38]QIG70478.1 hypothetical protein EVB89_015 [Rhizobium phage RHph_N38]
MTEDPMKKVFEDHRENWRITRIFRVKALIAQLERLTLSMNKGTTISYEDYQKSAAIAKELDGFFWPHLKENN